MRSMSRDRMPGGGFQTHAIAVYEIPGDTNAACDDPRHERADRKEPVVHKRSIIEIELPVCSLFDLGFFLKRMGLSGFIGEIEPLRAELHRVVRARNVLV